MTPNPARRSSRQEPDETPVVLPHVVIAVDEAGVMDVSVDGTDFPHLSEGAAWTRSSFGALLDAITRDRTLTVRIEVRESDGSAFTDIIHARRRTTPEPPHTGPEPPEIENQNRSGTHAKAKGKQRPVLVEVTAEGFVPGEDVAAAVIVSHTDATATGAARVLLETTRLPAVANGEVVEIVLLGRVSGTLHVHRLP